MQRKDFIFSNNKLNSLDSAYLGESDGFHGRYFNPRSSSRMTEEALANYTEGYRMGMFIRAANGNYDNTFKAGNPSIITITVW